MPVYDENEIRKSFNDLNAHKLTSRLITEHSTNKKDIREFALESFDFSNVNNILDLGCGFGFFTLGLKNKIKKGTHIVGLDIQETYQKPFLEACRKIGATGEFHVSDAVELVNHPPHSFDLVISSFSLYFFPEVIKYIPKILTKNGVFIAITHSEKSLSNLIKHLPSAIKSAGLKVPELLSIQKLFQAFSSENGKDILKAFFSKIKTKSYQNKLVFNEKDVEKINVYLKMKKHILLKEIFENEPDSLGAALDYVMINLAKEAKTKGELKFNKDDTVFICSKPKTTLKETSKPQKIKFCASCGNNLVEKTIEGKKRNICPSCGHIAYENPLPVVSAIVVNEKNEILLVKRARHPMKGMWCLPTGFAEVDENIEEAALRELKEETGISGKIKNLAHAQTAVNYFYGNLIMICFEVKPAKGNPKAGDDADEAKYFLLDGIPPLAFPAHENAIKKYMKSKR